VNSVIQREPTSFYLLAVLQKRESLRVAFKKIMYKTTDSQHLKLKREVSECITEIITQ